MNNLCKSTADSAPPSRVVLLHRHRLDRLVGSDARDRSVLRSRGTNTSYKQNLCRRGAAGPMVSGPSGPSQDLVDALAAESLTSLVNRTVLKFALCTVLAFCGNYVLGYVLPFLRFFSQIP